VPRAIHLVPFLHPPKTHSWISWIFRSHKYSLPGQRHGLKLATELAKDVSGKKLTGISLCLPPGKVQQYICRQSKFMPTRTKSLLSCLRFCLETKTNEKLTLSMRPGQVFPSTSKHTHRGHRGKEPKNLYCSGYKSLPHAFMQSLD